MISMIIKESGIKFSKRKATMSIGLGKSVKVKSNKKSSFKEWNNALQNL